MKTQVIQLDEHDDLISIRDRMAWAKTPRILLIWPLDGKVGLQPLDLTLLRRHTVFLGAELGLVTRNPEIRASARALKITIFSNAIEAQKKQWMSREFDHPKRRFPRQNLRTIRKNLPSADLFTFTANPIRRVFVFLVGVLAVLAVMLAFIPSADIQIKMPEQSQVVTLDISSSPDIQDVQISGIVPQHTLTLAIDGNDTSLPTGSATFPGHTAVGEALLMNLTEKAVSVPSGTILLTHSKPPASFETGQAVQVPSGKGKTARVSILATASGLSGNVDSGMITMFEGPLGSSLAVTNPEAITGGTQADNILVISDQDRENLKKRLLMDLEVQAIAGFSKQVSPGDVLFLDSLSKPLVIKEFFTPPVGETGEKLSLSLRVEYSMAYASASDLHTLAERVLNASLPAGYISVSDQIDLKNVSGISNEQGIEHWKMSAERMMKPLVNSGHVISVVQGKTVIIADNMLTRIFGLVEHPTIRVRPGWWPWLPFLPIRISVNG